MTTRITVKPADGRLVRHPGSYKPLAADGETVEKSTYWTRKLRAGDVVEVEQGAPAQKPTKGDK